MKTLRGYELAERLGLSGEHVDTLSKIARHAKSYHGVQEAICNGHPACSSPTLDNATIQRLQERHEAWCEKREKQLEARMMALSATLPGVKAVQFNGDPRGAVVRLMRDKDDVSDCSSDGLAV